MAAVGLDQVVRTLPKGGEIEFSLADIPLDEVLLVLHETRFFGEVRIRTVGREDRLVFRGGQLMSVEGPAPIQLELLVERLRDERIMNDDVIDDELAANPELDADGLGRALVAHGYLDALTLRRICFDAAQNQLFDLFERAGASLLIRRVHSDEQVIRGIPMSPLPAIAFGVIAHANASRRRAMLAYAATKRVCLESPYDASRNRFGLPPEVLDAVGELGGEGLEFQAVPVLPGLSPEVTAGVLLLFQRMGLLAFVEEEAEVSITRLAG